VELRGPKGKDEEIEEERGAFLGFATLQTVKVLMVVFQASVLDSQNSPSLDPALFSWDYVPFLQGVFGPSPVTCFSSGMFLFLFFFSTSRYE